MRSTPKNRNGSAPRRSYDIRPIDWRRRPPPPQRCDTPPAAPEFDEACWVETVGGSIAIRNLADHRAPFDDEVPFAPEWRA